MLGCQVIDRLDYHQSRVYLHEVIKQEETVETLIKGKFIERFSCDYKWDISDNVI